MVPSEWWAKTMTSLRSASAARSCPGFARAILRKLMPPISDAAVYDGLPPGPPLGALTHTARWMARPISLMERAHRRYGDVFTVRLLSAGDVVFVADPGLVKQVLTESPRLVHAGEGNEILLPLVGSRSLL